MNGAASGLRIAKALRAVRGFVFDVDGTLALIHRDGHRALPGAVELLAALRARAVPFAAFTNGSASTPAQTAAALRHAGLDLRDTELLTPASVAAEFFTGRKYRRVLVLGVEGVWRPLADAGIEIVRSPEKAERPDAVLVGWYPEFSLRDLEAACHAAWAGAPLYTASNAPFFATAAGRTLGVSRAICAAIHSVTGRRASVLGKPSPRGLLALARRMGVRPAELAVVGDDPSLEIAMARAAGAYAIAVATGLGSAAAARDAPLAYRPHLLVQGVQDLLRAYS